MLKKSLILFLLTLSFLFVNCSKDSDSSSPTTTTPSPTPTNPTTTSAVGVIGVSAVTVSAPSVCNSTTGISKLICLCDQFKASLSSSELASLQLTYSFANIKTWSNLPASMSARLGLKLGNLNSTQVGLAKAIIKEMTGSKLNEGYDEVQQLWLADDFLYANGGGSTYGSGNYYLAFFGNPAITGQFEIMLTGHHKTVANTYKEGVLIGATPHFAAVEPLIFSATGISYSPITQEKNAFADVITSLSPAELSVAKSTSTFSDLLLTPGKEWQFPSSFTGLQCNSLTSAQKALVVAAIKTYTDDIDDSNGQAILTKYTNEINSTYITYSGSGSFNTQNDYIRIDGPSVWIEFSVQRGIVLSGVHYHSVWRDRLTDYGTTR
jgi:hypothetical protein